MQGNLVDNVLGGSRMKSVSIHKDFFEVIREHSAEEIGLLFLALAADITEEAAPDLPPSLTVIRKLINQQNRRFSEKQAEKGKNGGAPKGNQNANKQPKQPKQPKQSEQPNQPNQPNQPSVSVTDTESDTNTESIKPKKRGTRAGAFVPPSLEEVIDYCNERNNGIEPQRFIDFYQSKGWMVGKNKMSDWQAAIRNWEQRARDDPDIVVISGKRQPQSNTGGALSLLKKMQAERSGIHDH